MLEQKYENENPSMETDGNQQEGPTSSDAVLPAPTATGSLAVQSTDGEGAVLGTVSASGGAGAPAVHAGAAPSAVSAAASTGTVPASSTTAPQQAPAASGATVFLPSDDVMTQPSQADIFASAPASRQAQSGNVNTAAARAPVNRAVSNSAAAAAATTAAATASQAAATVAASPVSPVAASTATVPAPVPSVTPQPAQPVIAPAPTPASPVIQQLSVEQTDRLRAVFDRFDTDHSNAMDVQELAKLLPVRSRHSQFDDCIQTELI